MSINVFNYIFLALNRCFTISKGQQWFDADKINYVVESGSDLSG